jgi:hypothetical protein
MIIMERMMVKTNTFTMDIMIGKVRSISHQIIKHFLDNREPMLYVDVNLGTSGSQRIVVFEGDKAEELAANFAARFGLDSGMQEKLASMLQQQISGVLEKIDEEVASSSNNSGLME